MAAASSWFDSLHGKSYSTVFSLASNAEAMSACGVHNRRGICYGTLAAESVGLLGFFDSVSGLF